MGDVRAQLSTLAQKALQQDHLFEILYADDTLLVGSTPQLVEEMAAAVEAEGNKYGMSLHWGKHPSYLCGNRPTTEGTKRRHDQGVRRHAIPRRIVEC